MQQEDQYATLVLKPSFSQSLSVRPLLGLISWKLTTLCLAVDGGGICW